MLLGTVQITRKQQPNGFGKNVRIFGLETKSDCYLPHLFASSRYREESPSANHYLARNGQKKGSLIFHKIHDLAHPDAPASGLPVRVPRLELLLVVEGEDALLAAEKAAVAPGEVVRFPWGVTLRVVSVYIFLGNGRLRERFRA